MLRLPTTVRVAGAEQISDEGGGQIGELIDPNGIARRADGRTKKARPPGPRFFAEFRPYPPEPAAEIYAEAARPRLRSRSRREDIG